MDVLRKLGKKMCKPKDMETQALENVLLGRPLTNEQKKAWNRMAKRVNKRCRKNKWRILEVDEDCSEGVR